MLEKGDVVTYRASQTQVEEAGIQAHTLDEATLQLSSGAYAGLSVFEGWQVTHLERHFDRIDVTLDLLGMQRHFDRTALRRIIRKCVERSGFASARLRLTLPRDEPEVAYVSLERWQPQDNEPHQQGVRAVTTDLQRENPRAKRTDFVASRRKLFEQLPEDVYELVLCGADGMLLEGSSSNFYAVLDGQLRMARDEVLYGGVARSVVLDACKQKPTIALLKKGIYKADLPAITEAIMSSASRMVVPIIEIDGMPVGDGRPGPVFAELLRRYQVIEQETLEDL